MGDNMDKKKKMVAAMAGVMGYLQEEQAVIQMQAAGAPDALAVPETPPAAPASLWGASGRQSQMQLRSLMQLRAFNRL